MKRSLFLILTLCSFTLTLTSFAAPSPKKKGEISMEKATSIATAKIGGTVKSSEYEFEHGQNVNSFDILASDGKIHEVLVSAKSGKNREQYD